MKILKRLLIIQEVSNANRKPMLGRGFMTARRFNPYNQLSYVVVSLIVVIGIILYGLIGFWKEKSVRNPFRWD